MEKRRRRKGKDKRRRRKGKEKRGKGEREKEKRGEGEREEGKEEREDGEEEGKLELVNLEQRGRRCGDWIIDNVTRDGGNASGNGGERAEGAIF